jgi:hypothetical protein
MKKCSRCKQEKAIECFPINKKSKDGKNHRCLECQKILSKTHYLSNKHKYKSSIKRRRSITRKYLEKHKTTVKCIRCGESDPICIDFHHKDRKNKIACISKITHDYGIQSLILELEKCEPICANCHRKLHRDELLKERQICLVQDRK